MTENNQDYLKFSLPSHQALGNLAIPHVAELSLGVQATEPDIMKALGFDQLQSGFSVNGDNKSYEINGVVYPHYDNQPLPSQKNKSDYSKWDIERFNTLQVYHGLIERGILITSGDEPTSKDMYGRSNGTGSMAFYRTPQIPRKSIVVTVWAIDGLLGGKKDDSDDGYYFTVDDRLVTHSEVAEVLDKLFEQPGYEKFRKAAEDYDAKVKEHAKAKPKGRFK